MRFGAQIWAATLLDLLSNDCVILLGGGCVTRELSEHWTHACTPQPKPLNKQLYGWLTR